MKKLIVLGTGAAGVTNVIIHVLQYMTGKNTC